MMSHWEKDYQLKGPKAQRRYPNEALVRFMAGQLLTSSKVLELGCGSGANLWAIAREGHQAYGIDYSLTAIKFCQEILTQWNQKAELKVGDITQALPYSDNYFDAIVDVVSIQHLDIKQHEACLGEIKRCLKQGGKFFSYHLGAKSVSFTNSVSKRIDDWTIENVDPGLPLSDNGPTCFLTSEKAEELLTGAGFKNIIIEVVNRSYNNRKQLLEYLEIVADG